MDKNILLWTVGIVGGITLLVIGFKSLTVALYEPSVAAVAFVCSCGAAVVVIAAFSLYHKREMARVGAEVQAAAARLAQVKLQLPVNTREIVLDPLSPNTKAQTVYRLEDGQVRIVRRKRRDILEEVDFAERRVTRRSTEEETFVMERPGAADELGRLMALWGDRFDQRDGLQQMASPSPTLSEWGERGGAGGHGELQSGNSRYPRVQSYYPHKQ